MEDWPRRSASRQLGRRNGGGNVFLLRVIKRVNEWIMGGADVKAINGGTQRSVA